MQAQIAQLQEQIRTHEVAIAELREKETELKTIVSTLQEMEKFMRESACGAAEPSAPETRCGIRDIKSGGEIRHLSGAFWRGCNGIPSMR